MLFDLLSKMTGGPSISKQGARSLILWSYLSGPDPSILAPYIYPLWTAGASYLPMKWSPNLVTLTGFTLILTLYGVVWHRCGIDCAQQEGYEQFAYWLYPLAAALIWGHSPGLTARTRALVPFSSTRTSASKTESEPI